MRNIKITLIILNIIFMLFIYYKIDNNTNDDSKLQHDVTNISKVLRIEISKNQKTISLVKNNFNWEITSPIKW